MSGRSDLRLDWCSNQAATYACKRWHYSRSVPSWKKSRIGVWERGEFIGCLIFTNPMPPTVKRFQCKNTQITELARVALRSHRSPVSRMIAIARKMLIRANPGLLVMVSYADSSQGHHGGIYQASGFDYFGAGKGTREFLMNGKWHHARSIGQDIKSGKLPKNAWKLPHRESGVKHCYARLLGSARGYIIPMKPQPFPKRVRSDTSDTPGDQPGEGGATPTRTLHDSSDSLTGEEATR